MRDLQSESSFLSCFSFFDFVDLTPDNLVEREMILFVYELDFLSCGASKKLGQS